MGEKADIKARTSVLSKKDSPAKTHNTTVPRSSHSPVDDIVNLHKSIGNQDVQRLYRSGRLQARLRIGQPNDIFEQEADRVAERVMRMPDEAVSFQPSAVGSKTRTVDRRLRTADGGGPCPTCSAEEEELNIRRKAESSASGLSAPDDFVSSLGPGQPLDKTTRDHFEPRFGVDFSHVRLHAGQGAAQSAGTINASAYTLGNNVVFGAGQYRPDTIQGKRLLAHELTHVLQQSGSNRAIQRQHVSDTGFRYTPPASVTRSIVEIQGIVGATPDGVYGENTRIAVVRYQTKLKAVGFYSDTLDGKWGKNTEAAHVAFAIAPNVERRGYNCAGFAFKDYKFHSLSATKSIYSSMTKLSNCSNPCKPFQHKFWLWEFNLQTTDLFTGAKSSALPDFHTVGGQSDSKGAGPDQVMSKNGQRPVEGPKPPLDWELKSGPAPHPVTGALMPRFHWTISGTKLTCFCNDKLP